GANSPDQTPGLGSRLPHLHPRQPHNPRLPPPCGSRPLRCRETPARAKLEFVWSSIAIIFGIVAFSKLKTLLYIQALPDKFASYIMDKFFSIFTFPLGLLICFSP